MGTATQYWSPADGLVFLTGVGGPTNVVNNPQSLNATQQARVAEAMGLWDDVSNFTALQAVDDDNLAAQSTTLITHTDYFLGIPYNTYTYWQNSLPNDWTRVLVGDIAGAGILGVNKSYGANGHYHEVYIDVSNEGLSTFQLGSRAFETVIHELGHSIIGGHISGDRTQTVMNASDSNDPTVWYASTPMTLDINTAIALYGASTTTRTGNDTYGFNAHFSGPYRAAFDFNVNTRPLVTIYDNGGNDTLDASGFRDASFNARSVYVDLQQGHQSFMLDGGSQTFAVIYTTSWIENAVGGGGSDQLIGNSLANILTGGGGNDTLLGLGGNDTIYGGDGNDTEVFNGPRSSYVASRNTDGSIGIAATGAGATDGTDTLYNVELFKFTDRATPYTVAELLPSAVAGSVSINDISITEGNSGTKVATFTVTRAGGTAAFNVNYTTADNSATVADSDYAAKSGTLQFGANVNTQTISVTINGDTKFELDQTFFVNLSAPTNGATISDSQAVGTIWNDDANHLPTVNAPDRTMATGQSIASGSLFTWNDADGQIPSAYAFWDSTPDAASGHFNVNNIAQPANQSIVLTPSQLAQTTFVAGAASDVLFVSAFDGIAWGPWDQFIIL